MCLHTYIYIYIYTYSYSLVQGHRQPPPRGADADEDPRMHVSEGLQVLRLQLRQGRLEDRL